MGLRRSLSDLLDQDHEELEAHYQRLDAQREAEAELESERASARYWEENHNPSYQEECRQDLELFEETWNPWGNR